MSYFSPHATWMSLVESQEPESTTEPDWSALQWPSQRTDDWKAGRGCAWTLPGSDGEPLGDAELVQLRSNRELRHRLFFHHREWEFGPALLEDDVRLAQAAGNPEEAMEHYCYARHTAKTLAEEYGEADFLPAWLELDLRIAEIHRLMDQHDSAAVYAREGLKTLRRNRFPAGMDAFITKLAFRFMRLLMPSEV